MVRITIIDHFPSHQGADYVQIGGSSPTYHELLEGLAVENGVGEKVSVKSLDLSRVAAQDHPMWDIAVSDLISPQGNFNSGVFEELAFLR